VHVFIACTGRQRRLQLFTVHAESCTGCRRHVRLSVCMSCAGMFVGKCKRVQIYDLGTFLDPEGSLMPTTVVVVLLLVVTVLEKCLRLC